MTSTPGASFGGGPEKKVGSIVVPESLIEQKALMVDKVANRVEKRKVLEALVAAPAKTPVDEFDAFKQKNKIEKASQEIRTDTVEILSKTPNVAAGIAANMEAFSKVDPDKRLTWKQKTEMPVLINLVSNTRAIEKAALTPDPKMIISEGSKLRGQSEMSLDARTEGDLRLKKDGTIEDRFILRPEGSVKEGSSQEGPVDFVAYDKKDFGTIGQEYQNSVGNVTGTTEKKGALSAENFDINLDISKEKIDAQKAEAEALIARLEARNAAKKQVGADGRPLGSEVTVNNFSAEEQAKKKAEWLRDHPQGDDLDIDLTKMENDALSRKNAKLEGADPDARIVVKPGAFDNPDARIIVKPKNPAEGMPVQERQALEKVFVTAAEKAPQRMEKISQVLEQRRNASQQNLEKMGANWLSKSLEAFKNARPGYKIALGVTLAGASIASGGLTALVGAGIMKGMSSLSYGSAIYDKMLKAKQDRGLEVNKAAIATNALVLGIGAALATSWIASEVFSHVDVPKALDGVKETVKGWWDSLVGATPEVVPGADLSKMPINGLTMDDGMSLTGSPIAPESAMLLPEYQVQPGDNLTKIIREQVLAKIPGVESLTELQKNNMIENYLQESAKNKEITFFNSINQFKDPNLIQPGAKLNLEEIRAGLTKLNFRGFGGGTLLEHAKTITGNLATGGALDAASVQAAASLSQAPVNPADFGAIPDAAQASTKVAEATPVTPVKPDIGTGLKMNSTGEGMTRSSGLDVFKEGQLPPQAEPGAWRDGSGNLIKSGSGGTIGSGGQAGASGGFIPRG